MCVYNWIDVVNGVPYMNSVNNLVTRLLVTYRRVNHADLFSGSTVTLLLIEEDRRPYGGHDMRSYLRFQDLVTVIV